MLAVKEGKKLMETMRQLLRDEKGTTAIEYTLIAGIMCLAIVAAVTGVGQSVAGFFRLVGAGFP